ncbi:MAG: translation initiation factor IF-3 [Candidatus Marinimicrobia bacterium]|nr:translation initiation factor IF-3 [Candidatus Neomarinimicrobiota bacterium]
MAKKFYRINQSIQAKEIRVVDETGKQIGVLTIDKALKQAQDKGLDLVEVAAKAKPPVCKIIDFKKFKFQEAKKQQQDKKKSKKVEIKVVQLSPFIAENDLNFRLKRAEEFLKGGDKVKIAVVFKGRQITKKEFGYQLLEKVLVRLEALAAVDLNPKMAGRKLEITLKPVKGGKNGQKTKDENEKINQKKI